MQIKAHRLALRLILGVIGLIVPALVLAQPSGRYYGLDFPAQIMNAARQPVIDYENRGHPGLGYSAAYVHPNWKADVYIYDLRRKSIAADVNSPDIQKHFAQTTRDVTAGGFYTNVVAGAPFFVAGRDGRQRFLCRSFTYVHKQIGPAKSALCLASWRNKFFKIRLTSPSQFDARKALEDFARRWTQLLWPAA